LLAPWRPLDHFVQLPPLGKGHHLDRDTFSPFLFFDHLKGSEEARELWRAARNLPKDVFWRLLGSSFVITDMFVGIAAVPIFFSCPPWPQQDEPAAASAVAAAVVAFAAAAATTTVAVFFLSNETDSKK